MTASPFRSLALLLAALIAPLQATTVPEMSFDEVVARSAVIVHGKVVRSRSSWDPERTAIWTHYDIQVRTRLKGGPGAIVTVSEPGGEVDGKRMQIVGAPRYEIGDEVVVFATETPIGYLRTCGWGQGKFEVRASREGASQRVVRASPLGVQLMRPGSAEVPVAALDGSNLEAFLEKVRSTLATGSARGVR
jgi:hypothetical protein